MVIDKKRTHCLVCGFDFEEEIDIDDHCPCCRGFQGYYQDDDSPEHIKKYRKYWLEEKNAVWGDGEEYQPKGWNKEMALKQIKDNVPEEFQ